MNSHFKSESNFLTINTMSVSMCTTKKQYHLYIQTMAMNGTYAYQMLSRSVCITLKQKMRCKTFPRNKNKIRLIEEKEKSTKSYMDLAVDNNFYTYAILANT